MGICYGLEAVDFAGVGGGFFGGGEILSDEEYVAVFVHPCPLLVGPLFLRQSFRTFIDPVLFALDLIDELAFDGDILDRVWHFLVMG